MKNKKLILKEKRKHRVRMKLKDDRPRLSVFRSNRYIYAQIIDNGQIRSAVSEKELSGNVGSLKKTEIAFQLGKLLADKAKKKKISRLIFDRSGYAYRGRVKALAQGAREGGLEF